MSDFTRRDLHGSKKKAIVVLDTIDGYLDAFTDWSGVVSLPECRLHVHSHHFDWLNNSLKRGPDDVTLDNSTYRGVYLIRY